MDKRAVALRAESMVDLHARKQAHCPQAGELSLELSQLLTDRDDWARVTEPLQAMMHLDFATYLTDDILVKVDRASMGASLEIRCPFLDHRIVGLAWRLPLSMRVGPHSGKRILRKVLERYVPRQLTERPKAGFGVPVSEWTRGPARLGGRSARRAPTPHGGISQTGGGTTRLAPAPV